VIRAGRMPGRALTAQLSAPLFALTLAFIPTTVTAQPACLPLGGQIALCPDAGSLWAGASQIPVTDEDGVTAYEAPPYYLEASLNWLDPAEASTLDAGLSRLETDLTEEALDDGDAAPVRRFRDTLTTEHATVALDVFIEFFDGDPQPLAVLLLADGDDWLTLFLAGEDVEDEDGFAETARDLARLLRPAPED